MSKKKRLIVFGILCVLSFTLLGLNPSFAGEVAPAPADEVTITGTINENYEIVADDATLYQVADTDMGNDLLNHVGKTVEVIGQVTKEEDGKVIRVKSYKLLEENK